MCNDRCPKCDLEMSPYASDDIGWRLDEVDYEFAARRLIAPLWPPHVLATIVANMEGR